MKKFLTALCLACLAAAVASVLTDHCAVTVAAGAVGAACLVASAELPSPTGR
jgi:hypothetical protein